MTKLLLTSLLIITVVTTSQYVFSQIQYPESSYATTVHQKVGLTDFTLKYERPLQRGRNIFGVLVPYGKPWRTGAGAPTRLAFNREVFVNGVRLEKGTYQLVTIPDENEWKIILSRDTTIFTENRPYDASREAVRLAVKPTFTDRRYEAFSIELDIVNNDALIRITWEKVKVEFTINTRTTDLIMSQIRQHLKDNKFQSGEEYGDAANFIAFNLTNLTPDHKDTALHLINKAMEVGLEPWMFRAKRNIYWFSKDLPNSEQITKEWVNYYRKQKEEVHEEEIKYIEEEQRRFRAALK